MLTFFKNRLIEIMEVATVLSYLFLTVEEEKSDENEGTVLKDCFILRQLL